MGWFILANIFSALLALIRVSFSSDHEKDLEILILRQQLIILERKRNRSVEPDRADKMILSILAARLKHMSDQPVARLHAVIRIFQPETVLRWHREFVRLKWTYQRKNKGRRPLINQELESLILRLAKENPRWGYGKIEGELIKLSFKVSRTTIQKTLCRHNILPDPVRGGSIGWRHLMSHYKQQILATDLFTVETIKLQTLYVLFFIELGRRRIHISGVTSNPDAGWTTQQARQLVWATTDSDLELRFLIHDNDTKFSDKFDTVFRSEGLHIHSHPLPGPQCQRQRLRRALDTDSQRRVSRTS
jgi:putative transposase